MTTAIAICKIRLADPLAEQVHTGLYDKAGNAIIKKSSRVILSGQFFEEADAHSLAELIGMGAARLPTAAELAERDRTAQEN